MTQLNSTPDGSAQINFAKGQGLVPSVVQHAHSGQMLMLGYMNRAAFEKTLAENMVWFYSRSKQRLWRKGETSGHVLKLHSYHIDCDNDALLILALPQGPTCHLGRSSCFAAPSFFSKLTALERTIKQRQHTTAASYTKELMSGGVNGVAQKVGEEAVETILALSGEDQQRVVAESADLIYHLLVGLHMREVSWQAVIDELERRSILSQQQS